MVVVVAVMVVELLLWLHSRRYRLPFIRAIPPKAIPATAVKAPPINQVFLGTCIYKERGGISEKGFS